jgi:hypothetical protein
MADGSHDQRRVDVDVDIGYPRGTGHGHGALALGMGTQNSKNKLRAPTWLVTLVGSSAAKKVPGLVRFFVVFLNSPHRETPQNVIKTNREKPALEFLSIFCKIMLKLFARFFL